MNAIKCNTRLHQFRDYFHYSYFDRQYFNHTSSANTNCVKRPNSPVWFTNHHVRALGIKVDSVEHLASKLLNQRRVINLLLRRHDRQLKLRCGQSTCLSLIKFHAVQEVHRWWFQSVFDVKAKLRGCRGRAGNRRGRVRFHCHAQFSYVTFNSAVVVSGRGSSDYRIVRDCRLPVL